MKMTNMEKAVAWAVKDLNESRGWIANVTTAFTISFRGKSWKNCILNKRTLHDWRCANGETRITLESHSGQMSGLLLWKL